MPEKTDSAGPPRWVQPLQCCRLQQGSDAVFEGSVEGSPSPAVAWTWKGKPLSDYTGKAGSGKTTRYVG